MLGQVMGSVSNLLPVVPKMNIKDPLKGVDPTLAQALDNNNLKLGHLDRVDSGHLEVSRVSPPSTVLLLELVQRSSKL